MAGSGPPESDFFGLCGLAAGAASGFGSLALASGGLGSLLGSEVLGSEVLGPEVLASGGLSVLSGFTDLVSPDLGSTFFSSPLAFSSPLPVRLVAPVRLPGAGGVPNDSR